MSAQRMMIGAIDGANWQPVGIQQITNPAGVTGLNATLLAAARFVTLQCETTTVRYADATNATISQTVGQKLIPEVAPVIYCGALDKLQFYQTNACIINIAYYK